jgi:hypothetical protein
MKQFSQIVLERRTRHAESFATEPFEAAWASEAIFFLTVEELEAARIDARVQISPDGINWVDEGTRFPAIETPGLHFVRVKHFGGWLRLSCELIGAGNARVLVHLILKE